MQSPNNLIWVDMEMTGLEPDGDRVIEIATIVTDSDLNTLAEGPVIAVHQGDAVLDGMDEWNTTHHTRSGLVDRVRASDHDEARASRETIAAVYTDDPVIAAHYGEVLWELGRQDEAIGVLAEAIERHPDDPALNETLDRYSQ